MYRHILNGIIDFLPDAQNLRLPLLFTMSATEQPVRQFIGMNINRDELFLKKEKKYTQPNKQNSLLFQSVQPYILLTVFLATYIDQDIVIFRHNFYINK